MDAVRGIIDWRKTSASAERVLLFVNACTYKEKIVIPNTVGQVWLKGESAFTVFFTFDDNHSTKRPDNQLVLGTRGSASTSIQANNMVVQDITFVNTAPEPERTANDKQAVAYYISGNYVAHYGCRFFGWQDTLYDDSGNHYFYNCYIQGTVDFIFGDGTSIYEECTIFTPKEGSLTAQRRSSAASTTGYVFLKCKVFGLEQTTLGRAWGGFSRVVFALSNLDNIVNNAKPWTDWDIPANRPNIFYAEYKNTGSSAVTVPRNDWTYILSDSEAAGFISYNFIDQKNWIPAFPPFKPAPSSTPFPTFTGLPL